MNEKEEVQEMSLSPVTDMREKKRVRKPWGDGTDKEKEETSTRRASTFSSRQHKKKGRCRCIDERTLHSILFLLQGLCNCSLDLVLNDWVRERCPASDCRQYISKRTVEINRDTARCVAREWERNLTKWEEIGLFITKFKRNARETHSWQLEQQVSRSSFFFLSFCCSNSCTPSCM